MTTEEVRVLADQVLNETLGSSGFARSTVEAGVDHDGDKALFVTAHFKPRSGVTAGKASLDAMSGLRTSLLDKGEDRFPYLDYDYPDDERPVADEVADEHGR